MFLAEELSIPKISRLLFCSLMLQIDWIPSSGNVPRAMPETMACHAMPETMHFPIKSDFNLSTNTYLGSIADTTEFSGWLSSSEKKSITTRTNTSRVNENSQQSYERVATAKQGTIPACVHKK